MAQQAMSLRWKGVNAMRRRIGRLDSKMKKKRVLRNSLSAGSRVILKQMKKNAPVDTGELKRKGLGFEVKVSTSQVDGESKIGALWPAGAAAHLVEEGTVLRRTKGKRAHSTGFVRGTRFMQRAWDTTHAAALDAVAKRMEEEILDALASG